MPIRFRYFAPAAIFISPLLASADTTVCVHTPAEFQTALTSAQTSNAFTLIQVARGIYNLGGAQLSFQGTGTGQLDISGGYNADCSAQILDPAFTVIDAQYLSQVLVMNSGGGVSIRYLTMQHGSNSSSYGGGLYVELSAGGLVLNYNIFRENVGEEDVALYAYMDPDTTGDVHVNSNLFVDNTAVNYLPGGEIQGFGSGTVYFTNNTVANNTISAPSGYGGIGIFAATTISNNILWGNDVDDLAFGSATLVANDFGSAVGTPTAASGGNVGVDPQFSATTDYHLLPTSPLLGGGVLAPAGNLPTIDIEGHPRSYNGLVDMGAYERGDEIFGYGFDD